LLHAWFKLMFFWLRYCVLLSSVFIVFVFQLCFRSCWRISCILIMRISWRRDVDTAKAYMHVFTSSRAVFHSVLGDKNLLSLWLSINVFCMHFLWFWNILSNLVRCIPLFRPSSSADENLHPAYRAAEERGRIGQDCRSFYPKCPVGLLDVIAPFAEWNIGSNHPPNVVIR
jgi:hypothetical protein